MGFNMNNSLVGYAQKQEISDQILEQANVQTKPMHGRMPTIFDSLPKNMDCIVLCL